MGSEEESFYILANLQSYKWLLILHNGGLDFPPRQSSPHNHIVETSTILLRSPLKFSSPECIRTHVSQPHSLRQRGLFIS